MPPPIIQPRKTPKERLLAWVKSWSPQVKQGTIVAIGALAVCLLTIWSTSSKQPRATPVGKTVSGLVTPQATGTTAGQVTAVKAPGTQPPPQLPHITIETLAGLPPELSNNPNLRLNRLQLRNTTAAQIDNFCGRLQLPEAIARTIETNLTVGSALGWRPLLDKLLVHGTGGRTQGGLWIGPTSAVLYADTPLCFFPKDPRGQLGGLSREGDLTGIWELTIDKLPPGGLLSLLFITSAAPEATNYMAMANTPLWQSPPRPSPTPDTNELRHFFEGEYQCNASPKPASQYFFVPIVYDTAERKSHSQAPQPDIGAWHPVNLVYQ